MLPHGFRDQPWTLDCTTQGLAVGQNMVGMGNVGERSHTSYSVHLGPIPFN